MRDWHDYDLTGYSVDGELQRIEFKLSWPSDTEPERWLLVFTHVEGYYLKGDLGVNIVLNISEKPVELFLEENFAFFVEEYIYGWPLFWRDSIEATAKYLVEKHSTVWEISSSYGLEGWVVAGGVEEYQIIDSSGGVKG